MARVFSIVNYKGGVGKSTTTYHIGCSLAEHHNKKVLLIDIDPQTNLTFLCKEQELWERHRDRHGTIATLYERFQEKIPLNTANYIWQSPVGDGTQNINRLDLLPCDIDLLGEDLGGMPVVSRYSSFQHLREHAAEYVRQLSFLRRVIEEVGNRYDYILIDCPPNLYLMTQNALYASEAYLVTAIPDYLSTIGLTTLKRKLSMIGERIRQAAGFARGSNTGNVGELGGVIFTRVRHTAGQIINSHKNTMDNISGRTDEFDYFEDFWAHCFDAYVTEHIGYSEAADGSVPIWQINSQNGRRAADKGEYEAITQEFMRRFPA